MFRSTIQVMDLKYGQSNQSVKRRRQDPVSCNLCRSKKLKCDRQYPCSNCLSRHVSCAYETSASLVPPQQEQVQGPNPAYTPVENAASPSDLSLRIQKLEESIHGHERRIYNLESAGYTTGRTSLPAEWMQKMPPETYMIELPRQKDTADYLEDIVMSHSQPRTISRRPGNEGPGLPNLGHKSTSESFEVLERLTSALPSKKETDKMVYYYIENISHVYHIIHAPTFKTQVEGVYTSLSRQQTPSLPHMAILFCILALAAHFWSEDLKTDLISSQKDAERLSQIYGSLSVAALVEGNYMTAPTIEGIQATLLMGMLLPTSALDTPIHKLLFFAGTIINQARNLMLHCTDIRANREARERNGANFKELEIKRRVWWHIVASDWLLSFMSGPQEHTYFIHPAQSAVDLPSNVDDDSIPTSSTSPVSLSYALPATTPTDMTYSLLRTQLAQISREIVDATSPAYYSTKTISYDTILALDRKLQSYLQALPPFFRLDASSRRASAPLTTGRPTLAWQRSMLNLGVHTRLCRLHRGFFLRGATDPSYAYSHIVCLRAARTVLETQRLMNSEAPTFQPGSSRLWTVVHHVFLAAVVLMMDVCFNRDETGLQRRKDEVLDACRVLDKAQRESNVAKEGIKAALEILLRYWPGESGLGHPFVGVTRELEVTAGSNKGGGSGKAGGGGAASTAPEADPKTEDVIEVLQSVERGPEALNARKRKAAEVVDEPEPLEHVFSEFLDTTTLGFEESLWEGLFFDLDSAGGV